MTERPILCTGSVVRNILAGRQTQDRRPVRLDEPADCVHPWKDGRWEFGKEDGLGGGEGIAALRSPFGRPGDLLYVRETARVLDLRSYAMPGLGLGPVMRLRYEADRAELVVPWPERIKRPTIGHCLANGCYKEAARIWLRVEDVWVERVQDITEDGAMAEGCRIEEHGDMMLGAPAVFARLWDSLYAKRGLGWDANPWVFACRFTVASTTGRPS